MLLRQLFESGRMVNIGRAGSPDKEDETDHWAAKKETGFYGRQGAGCIIMARDTGRFMLGLRSRQVEEPGTYGTFGGAIDGDEDPLEATQREVNQETGYTGSVEMIPLFVFRKGTFRYSNFLAIVDAEFKPRLNWEHSGFKWCEFGQWPQPLHFGVVGILNDPESVKKMQDAARSATGR